MKRNGYNRGAVNEEDKKMAGRTNCETCANFVYDDELETYCCDVNLDEDEMEKYMSGTTDFCHYFTLYDEYKVVRKQT